MAEGLGPFGWPLVPLAKGLFFLDRWRYRLGLAKRFKAQIPVVSIGNLSMGGAGKTPITRELSSRFQSMGKRPIIVSRGYGRRAVQDRWVDEKSTFMEVGDEPLLLARSPHQPKVWVSRKRARCAELMDSEDGDLILLDDGFQHWPLERDLDIVLLDANQGMPKPFPVGLFRESLAALRRAKMVVWSRVGPQFDLPSWADRVRVPHQFAAHFSVENFKDQHGKCHLVKSFLGKKVLALAGIAQPEKFFSQLEAAGLHVISKMALADHGFVPPQQVLQQAQEKGAEVILTTEKDYVKLEKVPNTAILWAFAQLDVSWDRPDELDATLKRLVFGEAS